MLDNKMLNDIKIAKEKLLNSGVIAFPTETVMGLGVIFDDKSAYDKMNIIKRRPEDKPYTLMLGNVDDLSKYAYINEISQKIIDAFLPGSLTILLKIKENVPTWVSHNTGIIGIRIPSHPVALRLLNEVNKPLLVPSANRSGEKPAMSKKEVIEIFEDELDFVLDGLVEGGKPSTIIDLTTEEYRIVREGPITKEMIDNVLKENN